MPYALAQELTLFFAPQVLWFSFLLIGLATSLPRADFGAGPHDAAHGHHEHHEHHEDHGHHEHEEQKTDTSPITSDKKCKLERSVAATSRECFLEPECENVCKDETRPQCGSYQEEECHTFDVHTCNTVNEEVCENVKKTVYEQVCKPTQEEQCRTVVRNECRDVVDKKCEVRYVIQQI